LKSRQVYVYTCEGQLCRSLTMINFDANFYICWCRNDYIEKL